MTPKEKAIELIDNFINIYEGITLGIAKKHWAKQSALISVDEILNIIEDERKDFNWKEYFKKVKKEIELL